MGYVRARVSSDGRTRHAAVYLDEKGGQRSAGTYATEAQATRAWQKAEKRIVEGRLGDARRGRQRFARYVEEQWLPHHQMEARTRENYTYYLARHTSKHAVTQLLRITWRTVAAIVARVVAAAREDNDPFEGLSRIGIDEISFKRGLKAPDYGAFKWS